MKKLFLIGALVALIATTFIGGSSIADEPIKNVKVRTAANVETEYTGKTWIDESGKRVYEYKAIIDSAPTWLMDINRPIDCNWHYGANEWYTGPNLFQASIKGDKVTVVYEEKKYDWSTSIYVDGKEVKAVSGMKIGPDPFNSHYTFNTASWDYGICTRKIRVIEGMISELWIFQTNPGTDVEIRVAKTKDKDFTWERNVEAWDDGGEPIHIVGNQEIFSIPKSEFNKATYPVIVDPTSSFYTSASDGYLSEVDAVYATARVNTSSASVYTTANVLSVGQRFAVNYYITRSGVYFDTSALPDGINMSSAELYLRANEDASNTNFNIEICNGMPTYPHDPLIVSDYNQVNYTAGGGTISTLNQWHVGSYCAANLTATGLGWINTTGNTKFLLRSSRDIGANTPTGNEYVAACSYEYGVGYRPYLEIIYGTTAAPTVTTNSAIGVSNTQATLRGLLSDDGNASCEWRFQYGTVSAAYTANTTWRTGSDNVTTGQSFSEGVSGLAQNTLHYFRAQARNELGTGSGGELSFTTTNVINPPTEFSAIAIDDDEIALTWEKGSGSAITLIRYKKGEFPSGTNDGSVSYNGTANSWEQTGLDSGITYYFRAWGDDAGTYSATYADDAATTFGTAGKYSIVSDVTTSGWFQAPNTDKVDNMPFSSSVNVTADKMGMPRASLWFILAISIAIMVGVFAYVMTRSILWTTIFVIVGLVIGVVQGIVPVWIVLFYAIIMFGLMFTPMLREGI